MDSKTDLSRCANNVATVRSALVPGLMPFAFNAISKAKSAGRSVAGCSVARNDLRNVAAVSRTSSAVCEPYLRKIWVSGNTERTSRSSFLAWPRQRDLAQRANENRGIRCARRLQSVGDNKRPRLRRRIAAGHPVCGSTRAHVPVIRTVA
jgi:hypothetical protein